jgi:hypothetical protein
VDPLVAHTENDDAPAPVPVPAVARASTSGLSIFITTLVAPLTDDVAFSAASAALNCPVSSCQTNCTCILKSVQERPRLCAKFTSAFLSVRGCPLPDADAHALSDLLLLGIELPPRFLLHAHKTGGLGAGQPAADEVAVCVPDAAAERRCSGDVLVVGGSWQARELAVRWEAGADRDLECQLVEAARAAPSSVVGGAPP